MTWRESLGKVGEGAGFKVRQFELNPAIFGKDKDGNARRIPVADPEHFTLVWLANFAKSAIVRAGFIIMLMASFLFTGIQALFVRVIGFIFIIAGYELAMRKLKEGEGIKANMRVNADAMPVQGKAVEGILCDPPLEAQD